MGVFYCLKLNFCVLNFSVRLFPPDGVHCAHPGLCLCLPSRGPANLQWAERVSATSSFYIKQWSTVITAKKQTLRLASPKWTGTRFLVVYVPRFGDVCLRKLVLLTQCREVNRFFCISQREIIFRKTAGFLSRDNVLVTLLLIYIPHNEQFSLALLSFQCTVPIICEFTEVYQYRDDEMNKMHSNT